LIALFVGLSIAFILIVLQPFGTAEFKHPIKTWILAGYGFTVGLVLLIYYFLSRNIFHVKREEKWNIVFEVLDLFGAVILSLLASYIYSVEIFGGGYDLRAMAYFLINAGSIALIPVVTTLFFLYNRWKDVKRSKLDFDQNSTDEASHLVLIGSNKSNVVKTNFEKLYLAKAQDNYVLLFLEKDGEIERHIIRSTLKQIEAQLDQRIFQKPHRSYIVNMQKVTNISGNKSKAALEIQGLKKNVPLSRNYYDSIKTAITI